MSTDPHEGIDPYNNPESRATERNQSTSVARAGGAEPTSPVPTSTDSTDAGPGDANPADEAPAAGTSTGDPLAGVTISEQDRAEAVPGDTGPEHPGQRRG